MLLGRRFRAKQAPTRATTLGWPHGQPKEARLQKGGTKHSGEKDRDA
jgi:hypothetical protein